MIKDMTKGQLYWVVAGLALLVITTGCRPTGVTTDDVRKAWAGFSNPQDSARTKVWWFHGETESTDEGITADLEAFKNAGVGGVVYYDQVHGKGEKACDAFSSEWWRSLIFASQEAKRLGLTFEVHISNGYVAGGPWITPELGMQRLACVDTLVSGGESLDIPLPCVGSDHYRDVALVAIPYTKETGADSRRLQPVVTSNVKGFDAGLCLMNDGKLPTIPQQKDDGPITITLDFGEAFTARSISYSTRPRGKATTSATNVPAPPQDTFVGTGYRVLPDLGELEVSDDGVHFRTVCQLKPLYKAHSSWKRKTLAFPTTRGRYYRLHFHDWLEADEQRRDLQIGNIVLSARACVDQWEEKAGLYAEYIEKDRTPQYGKEELVAAEQIVDLSSHVDSVRDRLRWQAPEGEWLVMRFVHLPIGTRTKHGRANLMGLECDKLSPVAARVQWNHYAAVIADSIAAHGGVLHGVAMDSNEAGSQNWTPGFEQSFSRLRGYDLLTWLPVMTGYVVNTAEQSDAVLYDVRRTIADLVADNHYAVFDSLCSSRGLTFTAEATGNALCMVADQLQAKGRVTKPQGEFWAMHPDGNYDIKESSSAAHLYGKSIASGEAFTDAKFSHSLAYIKQLADYAYCYGLNEFVVCASAAQPWTDRMPGNTGGGRHYCLNRNNTFWPYSRGFWDYQARCSCLMRQGKPVVDFCVYLGENAPVKILTHRLPLIPAGYDFDAFTTDALLSRMAMKNGKLTLPDGLVYRMMVLPTNGEMTLEALRKIALLVKGGLSVYGPRPRYSGTLQDKSQMEAYRELADALWGSGSETSVANEYGKGVVYWGMSLQEACGAEGMLPDVALPAGRKCFFAHRRLADGDIYFIDNHEDTPLSHTFLFRSGEQDAELWNGVTGKRYRILSSRSADGRIAVPLCLQPRESCVIVLHQGEACDEALPLLAFGTEETRKELSGEWTIDFSSKLGGPGLVKVTELTDWSQSADTRIRYYSGTAVYQHTFRVDSLSPTKRQFLQFSRLESVARITLNGKQVGTVWCSPWRMELTGFLQKGDNTLRLEVANALTNRMIGDAALPEAQRITYAFPVIAKPDDELVSSGIIGPVWLTEE